MLRKSSTRPKLFSAGTSIWWERLKNMVSDCSYCGILELREAAFFFDTATLLIIAVPAALVFTLWRIFVTNRTGPRGGVLVLGLDDSSFVYSDLKTSAISPQLRLLYLGTAVLTFFVGLFSAEVAKLFPW